MENYEKLTLPNGVRILYERIGLFLLYDAVNMVRFQCFVILLDGGEVWCEVSFVS